MDGDGKPDSCETEDSALLGLPGSTWTHRLLVDSDNDGLTDSQEFPGDCAQAMDKLANTSPRMRDHDRDGFLDGMEVLLMGTDPLDPNDPPAGTAMATDADGDGLPAALDEDDTNPDRDGDGFSDGFEVLSGSNPDSALSIPVLGDVNNSRSVNNLDAIMLFNFMLGNIPSLANLERGDVNSNGAVNNLDAIVLFNWTLGNVPFLPL